MNVSNILVMWK